jgi:hypothetical protein
MNDNTWFDDSGTLLREIPAPCVRDCSGAGQRIVQVMYWRGVLDFTAPRAQAVTYLQHTGGWTSEELAAISDTRISEIVLWLACCDIRETGEWFGLVE